ncbi:MAG: hypothetical protein IPJ85_01195 [Flavobacteriales bacterium]|nr:hypothetical protein [Flavobacteriales bacterium]
MNRLREEQQEKAHKPKKAGAAPKLPRALIGVLNGSFLTRENVLRNMPFILFCAGLMLAAIAYGYHTERVASRIDKGAAALKEQRAAYISARAELEKQEQQSQVAQRIHDIGLDESRVAPVKIGVDDEQLDETRDP